MTMIELPVYMPERDKRCDRLFGSHKKRRVPNKVRIDVSDKLQFGAIYYYPKTNILEFLHYIYDPNGLRVTIKREEETLRHDNGLGTGITKIGKRRFDISYLSEIYTDCLPYKLRHHQFKYQITANSKGRLVLRFYSENETIRFMILFSEIIA